MTTELDIATNGQPPATRGGARSALAITPDQTDWTPAQLAALRQLGLEDAPEGDLAVFRHVCTATGLDPFRKQIYMIGRKTKVSYYDEQRKGFVDEWVMKYTIQTGIDGFRRNGRLAAKRERAAIRVDGPYWQGADGGGWTDVWLSDQPPAAAKFTIFRDGEAHTGIAMYREFVQTDKGGQPTSMWRKMPANQTAKCAEAQAWRRAYPDDFAGMQLEDAMQTLDGNQAAPMRARAERVTAGEILGQDAKTGLGAVVQQWQAPPEPAPAEPETASESSAKPEDPQAEAPAPAAEKPAPAAKTAARKATAKPRPGGVTGDQLEQISTLLDSLGVAPDEKRPFIAEFFKREIADVRELTPGEGKDLIIELNAMLRERQDVAAQQDAGAQQALDTDGGAQ